MSSLAITQERRAASARTHAILRFGCGVTAAFVMCEWMGWYPTFLAPLLAATLIGNLPGALPLKHGLVLILVQSGGALVAFALSSLLRESPFILFGAIGLILLMSFIILASGRGFLPILLVLICFSTIPIVVMTEPAQAGALPQAFIRGIIIAVMIVWLVHAIWPEVAARPAPAAPTRTTSPVALAIAGIAIVLPLMLVYLMYGITDALPVLITTVVLVVNFDPNRSAAQGMAMMFGNFVGGVVALTCHALLGLAPSLVTLTGITLVVALFFGERMQASKTAATVGLITFNQAIVMLSLGLAPGPSAPGIWSSRLLQFGVAGAFAVSMMTLILPRLAPRNR
ncbi:MAG: DUF2955 domain-containing protein [Sphingomicrobium sp.]